MILNIMAFLSVTSVIILKINKVSGLPTKLLQPPNITYLMDESIGVSAPKPFVEELVVLAWS